jgi:predicted GIY-YIG superfamily endonuclease
MKNLMMDNNGAWVVYVIRSVPRPMRTYVGVTNNLVRRLRQHNGEIVGGARATHTTRPWELFVLVCGFGSDRSMAMRYEWFSKVKHYGSRVPGANGLDRRLFLLEHAMSKCSMRPRMYRLEDDGDRNTRTDGTPNIVGEKKEGEKKEGEEKEELFIIEDCK